MPTIQTSSEEPETVKARQSVLNVVFRLMPLIGYPDPASDTPALTTVHTDHQPAWTHQPQTTRRNDGITGAESRIRRALSSVKRHALFVIFAVMQTANTLRSLIYLTHPPEYQILGIVTTINVTHICLLYVIGYPQARRNFCDLSTSIRTFGELHDGYSFDVESFALKLRHALKAMHALVIILSTGTLIPMQIYFPAFNTQLAPFDDVEGIGRIVVIIASSLLSMHVLYVILAFMLLLHTTSIIIRKELGFVARRLAEIFKVDAYPVSATSASVKMIAKEPRRPSERSSVSKDTANCCGVEWGAVFKTGSLAKDKPLRRPEGTNVFTTSFFSQKQLAEKSVKNETPIATISTVSNKVKDGTVQSSTPQENEHELPLTVLPEVETTPKLDNTSDQVDTLETTFDSLCERYEAMCDMVEKVNRCCVHLYSTTYISAILLLCMVGFASAREDPLSHGELIAMSFTLCLAFIFLLVLTFIACSVFDASKAILAPLYAAKKAGLSPTLLQKIQLMMSRVTSGETGYHVYGLFVVNRPTILMLGGTILTYTVVVVQFQMGSCQCAPQSVNTSTI